MSEKILIVDDEKDILNLFENILVSAGHTVVKAESGKAALQILEREHIHIILMDIKMPDMDGLELCRKVKHHVPASICIAITGHASVFDLVSCREAGFDDYYEKPIPFDTLREVVGNAVATIGRWKTVAIDSEAEPAIQL